MRKGDNTMDICVYDWGGHLTKIKLPDKPISRIDVAVLSGDETGHIVFKDGTIISFDSSNCRNWDHMEGFYSLYGEEIQEWINFKPGKLRSSISRERMLRFQK